MHNTLIRARPGCIGLFDSGVGGLSIAREVRHRLPRHDLVYIADSAWVPYGVRSPEEIRERSLLLSEWLVQAGVGIVVVACNTATAAAVPLLRERLTLPVVGMEPAVKPAATATRSGVVGVLATNGTLQSARFAALLDRFSTGITVLTRPASDLVNLVEAGVTEGDQAQKQVDDHVRPLVQAGADVIVLGCTHFPFLRDLIQQSAGPEVMIIETAHAVAMQVEKQVHTANLKAHLEGAVYSDYFSTSKSDRTAQVFSTLLKASDVHVQLLAQEDLASLMR